MKQPEVPKYALYDAIHTLHINYGKGDYLESRTYADGRIKVLAKRTSCNVHTATGRLVNGRTVKLYRHQITVKGLP